MECHDPSACPGIIPAPEEDAAADGDSHLGGSVPGGSGGGGGDYFLHRRDPTGVMRRFTLGRHCRGRAAVVSAECGGDACAAEQGLRFRVLK